MSIEREREKRVFPSPPHRGASQASIAAIFAAISSENAQDLRCSASRCTAFSVVLRGDFASFVFAHLVNELYAFSLNPISAVRTVTTSPACSSRI